MNDMAVRQVVIPYAAALDIVRKLGTMLNENVHLDQEFRAEQEMNDDDMPPWAGAGVAVDGGIARF